METFDLFIVWRNGTHKIVSGVSDFGIIPGEDMFFFKKNGFTNFVVPDGVSYFGRILDWYNN